MKQKRRWVVLEVVAVVLLLAIVWFKWPVRLTKVDTSEVDLIVLQDGTTGNRVEIVSDFSVSGSECIRKDPFFYTVVGESMDVAYLEQLIEEAQDMVN